MQTSTKYKYYYFCASITKQPLHVGPLHVDGHGVQYYLIDIINTQFLKLSVYLEKSAPKYTLIHPFIHKYGIIIIKLCVTFSLEHRLL